MDLQKEATRLKRLAHKALPDSYNAYSLIGNPSILESNKHSEYPFLFLMNRKGYDVAYGTWVLG